MRRSDKKIHPARLRGEDMRKWPIVGRRQKAIAGGLTKPMTSTALALAVHSSVPTMERVQVARLLNLFICRGYVQCLNPDVRLGKRYELTEKGRNAISAMREVTDIPATPQGEIDEHLYAAVHRSVILRMILVHMDRHSQEGAITADGLRQWISKTYPVCYPVFYRGLARLQSEGLLRYLGKTLIGRHKMFIITESGKAIAERLMKEGWH